MKDAPTLRDLSRQLGYPLTLKEIRSNLKTLLKSREHRLWVATVDGKVAGFLQTHLSCSLIQPRTGEIWSAVVDENFRSHGIGRKLFESAEQWFKKNKMNRILFFSNEKRTRAHALYERIGYKHISSSKKFEKWI